jgi:hypothetical protein
VSGGEKQISAADREDIIGYTLVTPGTAIDSSVKKLTNENKRMSQT